MTAEPWRVGEHYAIHVYEGDRPVATFHRAMDAEIAVTAYNEWLSAFTGTTLVPVGPRTPLDADS